MDQDIEQIYNVLVGENYPVTLDDLRNPTSECMVKILLTFLSGFSIDGKTIQKPTFGQIQTLSYPEAHYEVISLINLHEVMVKISNKIFVKDFCLTDLTSPGAKKARRLIWTLLNFVLYANNKMEELSEPLKIILSRLNTLNDLLEKKNKVMELRKEVVLENSKKTALKEKYLKQIEEAKKRVVKKNKHIAVLEKQVQNAKLVKQEAQQKNLSIKQQVVEINEEINNMKETVVKSPEEYESRLGKLKQNVIEKQEELQEMSERVRAKQELKRHFEQIQDFVNQEYEKFPQVQEAHLKSKTLAKIKAEISKQLDEVQANIINLREEFKNADVDSQCDKGKLDEVHAQCREHIAPLFKVHMNLLSKTQDVQKKLEEAEIHCQQLRHEKDESSQRIISLSEQIAEFLKDCQNLYTNDIQKQVEIEKLWKSKYIIDE